MADLKISQLTGATTPLAGTEVLPVVQSGTTKQVSVANLTAGRSVATGPLAVSGTGNVSMSLSATSAGSPNFYIAPNGGGNAILSWTTGQALRLATADNSSLGGFVERVKIDGSGNTTPGADNTQTLGSASNRWSVVYAGTALINTSDAREKTAISAMTVAEIAAAKDLSREIGTFKFLAAVAEKGEAARTHIGMTVQRAIEIMISHGLDPMAYAFICFDKWDESINFPAIKAKDAVLDDKGNVVQPAVEAQDAIIQAGGDRYGFRVDQLLLFIARGFESRLAALEAK